MSEPAAPDGSTPDVPEVPTPRTSDRSPLVLPSALLGPDTAMPAASRGVALPTGRQRSPAERRLERVGIPAAVLAGVGVAALAVMLIATAVGWSGTVPLILLLVLAAITAAMAGTAVQAGILGRRRPRPQVRWESAQPWIGPLGDSAERRLVDAACTAAQRIGASAAWASPEFDDHRLTLDLRAELDQIDGQAYALAQIRSAAGEAVRKPPGTPSAEWTALADHVTALTAYAARLTATPNAGASPSTYPTVPVAQQLPTTVVTSAAAVATAAGAARDEFATAHLRQLSADLDAQREATGGAG